LSRDRREGADGSASARARWALVRRELASLRSEKTILLAISIQLFIAGFSSFLVVGLVAMYDPAGVEEYELEVAVTGEDRDALVAVAEDRPELSARSVDRGTATEAFEAGGVAAVLDANRDGDGRLVVRVTAPEGGLETTLLIVQLRETLETVEHTERVERADRLENPPLDPPDGGQASPYVEFTYTVLLPLLLFLPAFVSGSIAVDSTSEERRRGTLELLCVGPPSLGDVVEAKLLAAAVLAPLQAALWLSLLVANGIAVANVTALVLLVAGLAALVVSAGVSVALFASDRREAQLLYSGGLVAALVVAALFPQHPANVIARLAVGAPTATTWLLVSAICVAGIGAVLALRAGVRRLGPEGL